MVAWSGAEIAETYRGRYLFVGFMALFFSLDQIVLFQRIMDKNLIRGEVEVLMLPCMAAACMCIPTLRTRSNIILLAALVPLSLLFIPGSELFPRLVIPLQSLGIFSVLVSGLERTQLQLHERESKCGVRAIPFDSR